MNHARQDQEHVLTCTRIYRRTILTSFTQTHHQWPCNSKAEVMPSPEMAPLVRPGMPWISVTLLRLKYSLQLALSSGPLQKRAQSLVVTVTLSIISVFMHLSKPWFCRVRLPNKQTLEGTKEFKRRVADLNQSLLSGGLW